MDPKRSWICRAGHDTSWVCESPFIPTSPMTLAVIPLRRAKPDTVSTLHKRELTSGPQGHTWTEHRIALGTFSPTPRGLLWPKSHIFTWDSLGGGQAGFCAKGWSRSLQSAHLLVSPGEGPGQRGRPARRELGGWQVEGPASLQGPACSPHTVDCKCGNRILLELLQGDLLLKGHLEELCLHRRDFGHSLPQHFFFEIWTFLHLAVY